jgi:hypothetical protein
MTETLGIQATHEGGCGEQKKIGFQEAALDTTLARGFDGNTPGTLSHHGRDL